MAEEVFHGKWMDTKGRVKEKWGQLTDDDFTQIEGRMDRLAGKLQERYGYSKDRAEQEARTFFKEFEGKGGFHEGEYKHEGETKKEY